MTAGIAEDGEGLREAMQRSIAGGGAVDLPGCVRIGPGGPGAAEPPGAFPEHSTALSTLAEELASTLVAGRVGQIPGLARLRLVAGETRVASGPSGPLGRGISAGPVEVAAWPDDTLATELGIVSLEVECAPALAARIAEKHRPLILHCLPEHDPGGENEFLADTLAYHFESRGWEVRRVSGSADLSAILTPLPVALLLCHAGSRDAECLARKVKACPDAGPVSLVTWHPGAADPQRPDSCRVLGDSAVQEPFEIMSLLRTLRDELSRGDRRGSDLRTHLKMGVPTRSQEIDDCTQFLSQLLELSQIHHVQRVGVEAAFAEAISNAAQHGNAGDPERMIWVRYSLDSTSVTLSVTDEGSGFDHASAIQRAGARDLLAAMPPRDESKRLGGLGISMMMRCVDQVEYSWRGNSVTLIRCLGDATGLQQGRDQGPE